MRSLIASVSLVLVLSVPALATEAPQQDQEEYRGSGREKVICYGVPDRTGCKNLKVECPDGEVYRGASEDKCQPARLKGDTYQPPDDIGRPEGTQGSGTR
jgi:hypothetical protein